MRRKQIKGFSLVELMVFIMLIGIILAIGYRVLFYSYDTFASGSNQFQLATELRNVTDFITSETRNATELTIVSIPFVPQSGYYYIYLEDSKIKYQNNGVVQEKTADVIKDADIFEVIKDSNGKNFLKTAVTGELQGRQQELSTTILLNNITNNEGTSGRVIKYKKPD